MPYKSQKIRFNDPFLDKRCKLIPCQVEMVKKLHEEGWSQRQLATRFNVSRRLIVFTVYPERRVKNYQKRVERGGSKQYYEPEKWPEIVRNHRRRKHQILKNTIHEKKNT